MRKSVAVPLVITSSLALALSGCGSDPDPEYQGVCVDPKTEQRVADNQCGDSDDGSAANGLLWYYFLMGRNYPAVGSSMNGFSSGRDYVTSVPSSSAAVRGGAPKAGGKVSTTTLSKSTTSGGKSSVTSRGGFGSGAKGVSGS